MYVYLYYFTSSRTRSLSLYYFIQRPSPLSMKEDRLYWSLQVQCFCFDNMYEDNLPTVCVHCQIEICWHMQEYMPENTEGVAEFEPPSSPESSYGQHFPDEEEFEKEPPALPALLNQSVQEKEINGSSPKPRHVVLNHLFIEKGWASQSLVALGLTHRFQSKYVTVVLYKALKRWRWRRCIPRLLIFQWTDAFSSWCMVAFYFICYLPFR